MVPRAYLITPLRSNAITLTYSFNDGGILFDPSLPLENSTGSLSTGVFSFYHSLNVFGRSGNFVASLPYTMGHFEADVEGTHQRIYRSGLLDSGFRFSVNLMGAPAMSLKEFVSWQQKMLLGASITIVAPTGQYDRSKLINPGTNRWAFKPEFGFSRRWGHWILDGYGGIWLFTENPEFFSQGEVANTFSQESMIATEMHVSYDLKPGTWISFDCNYWRGGRTSVNGTVKVNSLQANSRVGVTGAIRVSSRHSLKVSYSNGAVVRIGGKFQVISVAWQYSWLGKP